MEGPRHVDGNALGGTLSDVFVADLTVALTICGECGTAAPLAELHVFLDAPGAVGRCASCGVVQIRLVRSPHHTWLDLTGVRALEIPYAAQPEPT
jgi:hypothetical protein